MIILIINITRVMCDTYTRHVIYLYSSVCIVNHVIIIITMSSYRL